MMLSGKGGCSGFIDLHTHLREPGLEAAEDITSEMQVAVTRVHIACHHEPVIDTPIVVSGTKRERRRRLSPRKVSQPSRGRAKFF